MSTVNDDETIWAEGTLPLSSVEAQKKLVVGYELGHCPGAAIHLALRSQGKPATALDGEPFPAALWEQSPKFTLSGQGILLAGIEAFSSKAQVMNGANEETALDPAIWKQALSNHMNVTARWFVVHDTAGLGVPTSRAQISRNASGTNMFMNQKKVFLNHDFSVNQRATKFENLHAEFAKMFIHIEMENPSTSVFVANPPPPPDGYNYGALALAYIFASYRAGRWLTVTFHLEMDRGIPSGHEDARGFLFSTFYKKIVAFMGGSFSFLRTQPPIDIFSQTPAQAPAVPPGSTFGIMDERIGDGRNMASYLNTFPAQYGPVLSKPTFKKGVGKKKKKGT
ncbi:MAG: hypothetical protein ABI193_04605 [Minicystis sp.]